MEASSPRGAARRLFTRPKLRERNSASPTLPCKPSSRPEEATSTTSGKAETISCLGKVHPARHDLPKKRLTPPSLQYPTAGRSLFGSPQSVETSGSWLRFLTE